MLSIQRKRKISIIFTIIMILGAMSTSVALSSPALEGPEDLFVSSTADPAMDFSNDPLVVRGRTVTLNNNLLDTIAYIPQDKGFQPFSLSLNLFDDKVFSTVIERTDLDINGSLSMVGRLEGIELSDVTITINEGVMWASVVYPGGFYRVRYAGNADIHVIHEINPEMFPPEYPGEFDQGSLTPPTESEPAQTVHQDVLGDDGSVIDVMVVYTHAARISVGGVPAMDALIATAISETNTGYDNSNINPDINLVHSVEVSYTEVDYPTDLDRLTDPSDGYMDNVNVLRDTYHADVVIMISGINDNCGWAWIMPTVSTYYELYAFSIVWHGCATGSYIFAHEIGHNQGARHDWYVSDVVNSPYSYNKGFVNWENNWRTIMAYNTECTDRGTGFCIKVNYWSNPNVLYQGNPTGIAEGTSTACTAESESNPPCDAENWKTLNNTAFTVSNFRDSTGGAGDSYEPDDSSGQAQWIFSGIQQNHSIIPAGDDDWVKFTVARPSEVVIETSGVYRDDTVIYLYSSDLTEIENNDDFDYPNTFFSKIDRLCGVDALDAGTYYVEIFEWQDNDVINGYNIDLTIISCLDTPADFDADGDTDVSVFRPSNGSWYTSTAGLLATFGIAGDIPVPQDYDGDGDADIVVYRPSNGRWYFYGGGSVGFGITGDIPMPCDYDGDGDADIAIYRPSNGRWYVKDQGYTAYGIAGDIPVPGDYDGDGDCDVAIYRPSNGRWYVQGQGYSAWGIPGDIPVPGDYDGDGDFDVAIYRPSNGRWYVLGQGYVAYGIAGDIPVPGDYDGDGDWDETIYRPSNGRWYTSGVGYTAFGIAGDYPLPARDTNIDGDPHE
ncbi:MAG: hypothetical protein FVQ83_01750 [Chloroflexi bacterium]|nr:hypothetical protein [Chloroflexota bacterium]